MATAVSSPPFESTRPRRRRYRRLSVGALVVAAMALALSACTDQELINQMNGSRASAGLRPLVPNATLTFKAAGWSQYMANVNQLVHSNLADGNNYQWRSLAENIGSFPDTFSMGAVNNTFMNSAPHRANILNGAFNYVGAGIVFQNGRMWVTEEFMQL